MVIYRFLRFGTREDRTVSSVDDALSLALDDMNTGRALPLEIREDGILLMSHGAIRQKFHQEVDNLPDKADTPGHKSNGDRSK